MYLCNLERIFEAEFFLCFSDKILYFDKISTGGDLTQIFLFILHGFWLVMEVADGRYLFIVTGLWSACRKNQPEPQFFL